MVIIEKIIINIPFFVLQGKEPDASNLDVDYEFYDEIIWPRIAHRFPQFEKSKVFYLHWLCLYVLCLLKKKKKYVDCCVECQFLSIWVVYHDEMNVLKIVSKKFDKTILY